MKITKIGIIGTGNLGRSIGLRLDRLGYEVFFGARRAEESEYAANLSVNGARSGSNDEAAQFGEVIFWAVRETDPGNVLKDPASLASKIIVDVNNRAFSGEADEGVMFGQSIGEQLRNNLPPSTAYVKALTAVSMFTLDVDPEKLRAADAQTFIAGSAQSAKQAVTDILVQMGLRAMDLGTGPVAIRAAEALGDVFRLMMANSTLPANGQIAVTILPDERLGQIGDYRPSGYIKGSVHERRVPHLTR